MKFKDYVLIITINLVTTTLIVSSLTNKNTPGQANVSGVQTGPQAPQVDSMDDHHKPQPAESGVFNSLLGQKAPDFTLENYYGEKVTLSSLLGKNVVLFFNEGLMCYPACWNQIAAFGQDKRFTSADTVTYSIVVDPKKDWQQAVTKMPELSGVPILFDTDISVSQNYGVLSLDSSMHRGQFPGHTYFLIDKQGIVRFTQDDPQMAVRNEELASQLNKI